MPLRASTHAHDCEVCGRTAPTISHPCRFDRACACWYGVPCDPPGADLRKTTKTTRTAALTTQEARP